MGQGKDRAKLTDGAKDPDGDTGDDGSSVDFTNEIVIEKGIAEAVADGESDDNVFEGDDSNLGQGRDWAILTDGATDANANAGDDGSLVDNIEIGGPLIILAKNKFAPNVIFRVVSCLCILCDLTCLISLKNSTHSHSYEAYRCFSVFTN